MVVGEGHIGGMSIFTVFEKGGTLILKGSNAAFGAGIQSDAL